jgi:hypothetical protein
MGMPPRVDVGQNIWRLIPRDPRTRCAEELAFLCFRSRSLPESSVRVQLLVLKGCSHEGAVCTLARYVALGWYRGSAYVPADFRRCELPRLL